MGQLFMGQLFTGQLFMGQALMGGRPFCYRCHKPAVTCICDRVPTVANRTRVWLLQHPRERFHPLGTARIARLGLANFEQVVAQRTAGRPVGLPADAALLYPGPEVPTLDSLTVAERPSTLVVLDGTWHHARTLFRDNDWLHQLPRYGLQPSTPSRYRLRKEPAAHCLSTIEAIVRALYSLEPDTLQLDLLLRSFESMIDDQIAIIAERASGQRQPKTANHRGVPAWLLAHPERVVAVSGEAAPRGDNPQAPYRAMHWVAARGLDRAAQDAATFEAFVRPPAERFPNACHLEHMGLSAAHFEHGTTELSLRERWRDFIHDDDVVVSWTGTSLNLLRHAIAAPLGTLPSHTLQLKSVYCSYHKGPCGRLEELCERLALTPVELPASGRAALAVGHSLALLAHLREAAKQRATG